MRPRNAIIAERVRLLGGGMVEKMPTLIRQEVERGILENAAGPARRGLKIVTAKLKAHAVTTGAAKLAWDMSGRFTDLGAKPDGN